MSGIQDKFFNMLSDEHLMTKVRQGDLDLLKLLFERYQKLLYNFYLKSLGNSALSADLTQEVFYRILKYRNSYKDGQNFRTWLFKIAFNVRNDSFQKEKKYREMTDLEEQMEIPGGHNSEVALEKKEALEMMKRALTGLSLEKRELITLSVFTELPIDEVAEIFGITANNARVRLHRAINELKESFKGIYNYGT